MQDTGFLPFIRLADQFSLFPGIGRKTAQRLAYYVLSMTDGEAVGLADAILDVRRNIRYCTICQNLSETELCPICDDYSRDRSVICVVEDFRDVYAMERLHAFNAVYHVLHGVISPLNGVTPEKLRIKQLMERVMAGDVKEVILATNATAEGEATAMYISRLLKPLRVRVTRLAYGIPVGGELEYADETTLRYAIEGRKEM